jgi:glycosyltransferase involved in cell wall biosynthesis
MLAIVIPYFKHTFFEATLESLANQTDTRFKVYIGDDASPENPLVLLEKCKGKFDFVYHRFENNLGGESLVKQWERCIALSGKEEWLMILGDDDVLGDNVIEAFYENLEQIKLVSNVVRFATCKIGEKGDKTSLVYCHPKIEKTTDFLFRNTRSSLSEYVFNKNQVNTIGFNNFPLAWFSDVLAVLEFSDFKNIYSINEAQVYVRITDLSISGKKDNFKLKSKAKFEFYYYLLTQKIQYFSDVEKKELFFMINKCYINDKKEYVLFFKISKIYLNKYLIKEYFSFIQLIILKGLKQLFK